MSALNILNSRDAHVQVLINSVAYGIVVLIRRFELLKRVHAVFVFYAELSCAVDHLDLLRAHDHHVNHLQVNRQHQDDRVGIVDQIDEFY